MPEPDLSNPSGTQKTESNRKAYLFFVICTWCWGCNAVFSKVAIGQISPMLLVTLRWVVVVIFVLVVLRNTLQEDWQSLKHHKPFIIIMGTIGFTIFNALFYFAAHSTSAINLGIIQGSIPAFVLLGSYFFLGTRSNVIQLFGVSVSLVGVIIVTSGGNLDTLIRLQFNPGDIYMLIASFLYAIYSIGLTRRPNSSALGLFSIMACVAMVTSLPLTAIEIANGNVIWPTTTGWIVVLLVALLPSLIAQISFINGVALIGPSRASLFFNLVPVFAALMATLYLSESFQVYHAISLLLVISGILLSEKYRSR